MNKALFNSMKGGSGRARSHTSVEAMNLIKLNEQYHFQESLMNYLANSVHSTSTMKLSSGSSTSDDDEMIIPVQRPRTFSIYFAKLLEAAGSWHLHRFEATPWKDLAIERKILKLKAMKHLDEKEEKDQQGVLTEKMMASALQYLEKCPEILKYVLSKCVLHNLNLTDISLIHKYNFIQYLDVSGNRLKSLEPLGNLPFLQYLNASNNCLTQLLDFKPPFYLGYVDYSDNLIEKIPDLTGFWSLLSLKLGSNNIEKIEGLRNLKYLNYVVLDKNRITKLENLDHSWIKVLYINENLIKEFEGDPFGFGNMVDVDMAGNDLTSLCYFDHFTMLQRLNVAYNCIANLLDIYYLQNKRYLRTVDLRGNPISFQQNFIQTCMMVLKQIYELNGETLTPEKKASFKNECEIDHLDVRKQKMQLMVLEHLNVPKIANYLAPYDVPPPNIVVFVGVPASGKMEKVIKCIKTLHSDIAIGLIYTNRPKRAIEVDGENYQFVTNGKFSEMTANGEFLTLSEFDGYCYGIKFSELEKGIDKMLVFQSDVRTGLSLRLSGLRPKLILTIPRDENEHLAWLKLNCKYSMIAKNAIKITYADALMTKPVSSYALNVQDVHYFEKRRRFSKLSQGSRKSDGGYEDDDDDDIEDFVPRLVDDDPDVAKYSTEAMPTEAEYEEVDTSQSSLPIEDEGPEHLMRFYQMILKERAELLQLHWDNPGFFRDVVFTDDPDVKLAKKLRGLLKCIQENYKKCAPTDCLEGDESLEAMVNDKLSFIKLEENLFNLGGY